MRIESAWLNLEKALNREGIVLEGVHLSTIDPGGIGKVLVEGVAKHNDLVNDLAKAYKPVNRNLTEVGQFNGCKILVDGEPRIEEVISDLLKNLEEFLRDLDAKEKQPT